MMRPLFNPMFLVYIRPVFSEESLMDSLSALAKAIYGPDLS